MPSVRRGCGARSRACPPSPRPICPRSWRSSRTSSWPSPTSRRRSWPISRAPDSRSTSSTSATSPASCAMIRTVAALVGVPERGRAAGQRTRGAGGWRRRAAARTRRPRVYFEEWDAPLIAGHRLGLGADRGRRRRRCVRSSARRPVRPGADRDARSRDRGRARGHPRLLVRQARWYRSGSPRAPAGTRSRPCATVGSSRSSRR